MDNLDAHKVAGVAEEIAAARATIVYLPRYSPDLNPIEQIFAKLKHSHAKPPPAPERLWDTIGQLLKPSPDGYANYLQNAG